VAHLNVNPCHILLDYDYTVKLCDFQMSTRFEVGQELSEECGAWSYRAPEMFLHEKYHGPKADAWGLGGVLYYMVVGMSPNSGKTFKDIRNKVLSAAYCVPQQVSAECQNVLAQLFSFDSSRRPTVEEILEHAWLHKGPPSPPIQTLSETPDPNIISAMATIGFDPSDILQSLQTKEINEATAFYLLFEEQARKQADGPMQLGPVQPGVTPCPSPTDLSTCSPPLRRTASAPALSRPFFLTSQFNHLSQDYDNSVKKGGTRTFMITNPLFNRQKKVPISTTVPQPPPVDPEGDKSAELKSTAENTLPPGQSRDVMEGNHLPTDDNPERKGRTRTFITTSPLFNPRRKISSTIRVSPSAPVDPEGSKSAELQSPVENALPPEQSQAVKEGATPNRRQRWREVTRRLVANILRICCCLPSSNAHHHQPFKNKVHQVQQDDGEQVEMSVGDLHTTIGKGPPGVY
jgi:serine/threonine protein kinase